MIVPTVLFPPRTPFTLQSTAVCEVPVTVAVKSWVSPARTVGDGGKTSMETLANGGGGGEGGGLELPPPQPQASELTTAANATNAYTGRRRTGVSESPAA